MPILFSTWIVARRLLDATITVTFVIAHYMRVSFVALWVTFGDKCLVAAKAVLRTPVTKKPCLLD